MESVQLHSHNPEFTLKKHGAPLHWQSVQFLTVTAVTVDREDSLGNTEFCELVEGNVVDCLSCSAVELKKEAVLMVDGRAVEECFGVDEDKVVWVGPNVDVFGVVELKLTGGKGVSFDVYTGLGTTVDVIDSEVEGNRSLEVKWVGCVETETLFVFVIGNDIVELPVEVGSMVVALSVLDCRFG